MIDFLIGSFVVASLSLFGLSDPKVSIILAEQRDGKDNAIIVSSLDNSQRLIEQPLSKVELNKGGEISEPITISREQLESSFGNVILAMPKEPFYINIYFKIESISEEDYSKEIANAIDACDRRRPCEVDVIGYFNAEDSTETKLIISRNRDNIINKLLQENMFKTTLINSIIYGESISLVSFENNVSEREHRRVEIIVK